MIRDESDRQQRLIDREMRLSRSREIIEQNHVQWQRWAELVEAAQEQAWLRAEVADLIAGAGSLGNLRELGISDELIRELRLSAAARRLARGGGRSGRRGARSSAEYQRRTVKRGCRRGGAGDAQRAGQVRMRQTWSSGRIGLSC